MAVLKLTNFDQVSIMARPELSRRAIATSIAANNKMPD